MNLADLRIVFAGTPDFAATHLLALVNAGCNIVSVYSQPDKPTGRGKKILPPAVKALALEHGLTVHQPLSLQNPEELARLAACEADVMVVVAYGLLLPAAVLSLPRWGCLNVHPSLLPRWRGAAPIERALMEGDSETGVSIMLMDEGLDTGPVLARLSTTITAEDNSESLGQRLCQLGCETLLHALASLPGSLASAQAQDDSCATYAHKIRKSEAEVDWQLPAVKINHLARALYPRSPVFTWHNGSRLRLLHTQVLSNSGQAAAGTVLRCDAGGIDIACGEGVLRVTELQAEGRKAMSVASLLNGHPDFLHSGTLLGGSPQ